MTLEEVERDPTSYRELKFVDYIKHKGIPEYEIAFNKKMLELIERDPTGGYREKRLKNIEYWEGIKKC